MFRVQGGTTKNAMSVTDFLQALSAGLLVGSAYALMCIGLGIIFGSMRVVNFAQGDFLMLGMYAAFYLTTGWGVLAFLGPYAGPIVAAFMAGPIVFGLGWVMHKFIVSRVTGSGQGNIEGAGAYGQILVTLGISLILQNVFKMLKNLPSAKRIFPEMIIPKLREVFTVAPAGKAGAPDRDSNKEAGLMVLLENILLIANNTTGKEFKDGTLTSDFYGFFI